MIQKVVRGWLASKGADIASAATTDLGAVEGLYHDITGTTTITSLGTVSAGIWKVLTFEGVLTLTHNATSLILPGGASITTAVGDVAWFASEGSGNWRCNHYQRAATAPISASNVFTTGDVKLTIKTVADVGWVLMNDGTIGNAASGGTTRANADTVDLFTLLWNNTADAQCAVSTGRGASAAADYAANKTIALPKALGRALAIYGTGSGLSARVMAQIVGAESRTIAQANLPASGLSIPSLSVSGSANLIRGGSDGGGANNVLEITGLDTDGVGQSTVAIPSSNITITGTTGGGTTGNMGSGTALDVMNPMVFLNVMIKL